VIVDLARLRFIDASGIGLLVMLGNELAAYGARLHIVNPDARTARVFAVCGLDAMLTVPFAP
jgi:anti-anti-sigma factor